MRDDGGSTENAQNPRCKFKGGEAKKRSPMMDRRQGSLTLIFNKGSFELEPYYFRRIVSRVQFSPSMHY
jgi:hypothetical protein